MSDGLISIEGGLRAALAEAGADWQAIREAASEVIVFGSRAVGRAGEASDWDVLCVGAGQPVHTARLDLIWKRPDAVRDPDWMDDELAVHIRAHGIWLKGEPVWLNGVHISPRTVARKRRVVEARVAWADARWARWRPAFRVAQATRIRRDVQRLAGLRARRPIPPRPVLDDEWQAAASPDALARAAGLDSPAVRRALAHAVASPDRPIEPSVEPVAEGLLSLG